MTDESATINGSAIKAYRKSIGMSRNELGATCHKSGQWILNIENGNRFIVTDLDLYRLEVLL
jgi:transcriptional regulator with XRE-family HTH domain